jgi:hypothetical protein
MIVGDATGVTVAGGGVADSGTDAGGVTAGPAAAGRGGFTRPDVPAAGDTLVAVAAAFGSARTWSSVSFDGVGVAVAEAWECAVAVGSACFRCAAGSAA